MQEWYKHKGLLCFFLFLIVFPISLAYNECQGTIEEDDVPCLILLPFNQSNLNCVDYSVDIYTNNTLSYTQVMTNYSPFICSGIFNETAWGTRSALGTYNGAYSTGDTFSIIVVEGYRMIYLFYFILALSFLLFGLGLWKSDATTLVLSGLAFFLTGVYVAMNGFGTLNNLLTWIISGVLWGFGIYVMIRTSLEIVQESGI